MRHLRYDAAGMGQPPRADRRDGHSLAGGASPRVHGKKAPRIVCATGPESAGKTTLCRRLAAAFGVPWLPEYAREHLAARAGYDETDVAAIAREHMRREAALVAGSTAGVVLDTDLSVILIWWRERFGPAPPWLEHAFAAQSPRLYLLCRPDLPWQPDPLRETAGDRCRLLRHYRAYRDLLAERALPFVVIDGQGAARDNAARRAAAPCVGPPADD